VGLALGGAQMLTRGWHSGPIFGGPAAAAAVGTLYGLDAERFEDALGLAATQACGLMAAQFGSMGKRMQHGFAARNGLLAATLAAGGYTGIKEVFEREYGGFLSTFGEGHDPDASQISAELGERWETSVIAIKPYAAMAGLHATIDAARKLLAEDAVDPDEVTAIDVFVSEPVFQHGGWRAERPLEAVGAQMSLAYAVAVTLLDGTALAAQFAPERIDADDVWALIERTTARHETAFDERYEDGYNTRLEVTLSGGARRTSFIDDPRGGLQQPLTNSEVVEKFRTLADPLVGAQRAGEIEHAVLTLETLENIDGLIELLAVSARPLFTSEAT
jgi:2-methylcitrate dehydratase PrpD